MAYQSKKFFHDIAFLIGLMFFTSNKTCVTKTSKSPVYVHVWHVVIGAIKRMLSLAEWIWLLNSSIYSSRTMLSETLVSFCSSYGTEQKHTFLGCSVKSCNFLFLLMCSFFRSCIDFSPDRWCMRLFFCQCGLQLDYYSTNVWLT